MLTWKDFLDVSSEKSKRHKSVSNTIQFVHPKTHMYTQTMVVVQNLSLLNPD